MKKRALITIVICTLIASVMMPFSISAATVSGNSPIIGVNVYIVDREQYQSILYYTATPTTSSGAINSSSDISGNTSTSGYWRCMQWRDSNSIASGCAVWGTTQPPYTSSQAEVERFYLELENPYYNLTPTSQTTNIYLYKYDFVFDNYYVGYINIDNVVYYVNGTHLEINGTSNKSSFNVGAYELNLLDSNKTMWMYPIESYLNIATLFNNGFEQVGINSENNYLFPLFQEDSSKQISNTDSVTDVVVVLFTSRYVWNVTQFDNYFSYNTNYSIKQLTQLTRSTAGYIVNIIFGNDTGSSQQLNLKSKNSNGKFCLIYNRPVQKSYPVSNDFALEFGLKNDMLNNLDNITSNVQIIADGTSSSNNKVSEFNQESDQMHQTISDYNSIENQFNDDFNDNMNAITPEDNGLNLMGSRFLNSANWVKTQFDRMTNNTPFGSVLGFSLVLGLGLLIIGRVLG